ncbi:MAG: prepilin-type N-terminal cleavage/methylation domain-containing protein [Patescibacteria group bacterium]
MKSNSAYTLVELLVGILIISIVFGVGFAGYRDFSRRQTLTGVSKQLVADLRLIQQLALTGQKPSGVSCDTLNSYTFSRTSASTYNLIANCVSNLGVVSSPVYKNVNLGSTITFTSTNASFRFKVLGQGTNLTVNNIITLTHTSGNTNTITVGIGGDIR